MVICGNYMFEFSVSKKEKGYNKGGGSREGSATLCLADMKSPLQTMGGVGFGRGSPPGKFCPPLEFF